MVLQKTTKPVSVTLLVKNNYPNIYDSSTGIRTNFFS